MTEHEPPREAPRPQPPGLGRAMVAAAWRRVPRSLPRPASDLGEEPKEAVSGDGGVWLLIARGLTCFHDPRGHTGGQRD